jgi:tetratricopeptide (TPR) repeat protein
MIMKKIVFTSVLCFLVSLSFGQKKAVNAAKNELKSSPPNFSEARAQIKEALANPETENDAEAWYVAGQIENRQFDDQRSLEILGKKPDEEVMYGALQKILPYFLKAVELDQVPDAKGKIKRKFTKDIRANIRANRPFYINAGLYAYEKKNYQQAYEDFKQYGDIPSMDLFKDDKWVIAKGDTTEMQIRYYAGLAASLIPDHPAAIAMFNDIKNNGYVENTVFKESDIYQRLSYEYNQTGDSTDFEKIIKEGFNKFPGDEFYVSNLINLSINSGKLSEAVSYLQQALSQHPDNAQLYDVMGQVYEADKNYDSAISNMKKASEMDPKNADFLSHIGRVYFNMGVEKRKSADELSDVNQSKEATKQSQDYFKESMPFFEKVFEMDPKNSSAIFALRSIYYNLGMGPQYEKMDALYNSENGK